MGRATVPDLPAYDARADMQLERVRRLVREGATCSTCQRFEPCGCGECSWGLCVSREWTRGRDGRRRLRVHGYEWVDGSDLVADVCDSEIYEPTGL